MGYRRPQGRRHLRDHLPRRSVHRGRIRPHPGRLAVPDHAARRFLSVSEEDGRYQPERARPRHVARARSVVPSAHLARRRGHLSSRLRRRPVQLGGNGGARRHRGELPACPPARATSTSASSATSTPWRSAGLPPPAWLTSRRATSTQTVSQSSILTTLAHSTSHPSQGPGSAPSSLSPVGVTLAAWSLKMPTPTCRPTWPSSTTPGRELAVVSPAWLRPPRRRGCRLQRRMGSVPRQERL
jgi:hypothetical protein